MVQADTLGKPGRMLCIVGPTACHKTEVAIAAAKRLDGEIVSADSVQVYIGMDVGSAKPTLKERAGIPHHMLDCVPIDTAAFSVSQYREGATAALDDIVARGKLPILVGGSGLYVSALTGQLNFAVPGDPTIRAELEGDYDASRETVFDRLRACDPATAARLHINDKKRVVRALEVFLAGGKPLSAYGGDFGSASAQARSAPVMIGLTMDRAALYQRIDQRVDEMLAAGLYREADGIYHKGYDRRLPAMQSIGYKQLFDFMDGSCSMEEAVERIKRDTRRFAKRQFTWFERDGRIVWFDVTNYDEKKLSEILTFAKGKIQTV